MLVIAIMALLAAFSLPNYHRIIKRTQAGRIIQDLKVLDMALSQYAIEFDKTAGTPATFTDLQPYLKTGSQLATQRADLFGSLYGPFSVDSIPKVSPATFAVLSDVADATFWSPYY